MFKRKNNSRSNGNYSFIKPFREVKRPVVKIIVLAGILLGAILLYVFDVGCLWQNIFGFPCASCGITRAWIAFFQLNFAQAFEYNFMFLSIPVLAWYILFDCEPIYNKRVNYGILIAIVIGFCIRYVLVLTQ